MYFSWLEGFSKSRHFLSCVPRLSEYPFDRTELTPSKNVVIKHFDILCFKHLDHFKVQMQALHQHPGKRGQEKVVQQHGD